MKKATRKNRIEIFHYGKMVLVTSAFAAFITACGGGNSEVAKDIPNETTNTKDQTVCRFIQVSFDQHQLEESHCSCAGRDNNSRVISKKFKLSDKG